MNKIEIVYNNMQNSNNELIASAGFSTYIEFEGKKIIFDTGADSTVLSLNLKKKGIKINKLDAVFISHNHWDHVFGLAGVLRKNKFKPNVHVPDESMKNLAIQIPQTKIVVNYQATKIFENVWSSGAIKTEYREQELYEHALFFVRNRKATVIVGCSHPCITTISEKILALPFVDCIDIIIGGFHWRDLGKRELIKKLNKLKNLKINKIAPSHCTGNINTQILKEEWKDNFVELFLGDNYEF